MSFVRNEKKAVIQLDNDVGRMEKGPGISKHWHLA